MLGIQFASDLIMILLFIIININVVVVFLKLFGEWIFPVATIKMFYSGLTTALNTAGHPASTSTAILNNSLVLVSDCNMACNFFRFSWDLNGSGSAPRINE